MTKILSPAVRIAVFTVLLMLAAGMLRKGAYLSWATSIALLVTVAVPTEKLHLNSTRAHLILVALLFLLMLLFLQVRW